MSGPPGHAAPEASPSTPGPLPAREAGALVNALGEDAQSIENSEACARLAGLLKPDESVLAIAPCVVHKPHVLALTGERLLAVRRTSVPLQGVMFWDLADISSVRLTRQGLLMQLKKRKAKWGFRMTEEAARRFIEQFEELGVSRLPSLSPQTPLRKLHEKERSLLLEHIAPDEWVFMIFRGPRGQAMAALADRLLIAKRGWLPGDDFRIVSTILYRDITGIVIHEHRMSAAVEIQTTSASTVRPGGHYWCPDKTIDPDLLPNCLPIASKKNLPAWRKEIALLQAALSTGGFTPPTEHELDYPLEYQLVPTTPAPPT